jgi:hypothetical protein
VFDTFVEEVLRKGGYLNTEDIVTGLSPTIKDLHVLPAFKSIQGMNKVVHAAVLCYWQGRSIRIFSEMEKFVTKQVAGYRQLPAPPETFEELGMGSLAKNEVVVKFFDFYKLQSKEALPEVTSRDVLLCMQEFTAKNRHGRPDEKLEAKFEDYLRAHFGCNICGVNVEFKSLFHSTNQTRGAWFGELRAAKEQYAGEYRQALQKALQRLVPQQQSQLGAAAAATESLPAPLKQASSVAAREAESRLRVLGVDAQKVFAGLGALGLKAQSRFSDAAVFLYTQQHANPNRRFGLAVDATVSTIGVKAVAKDHRELVTQFTLAPDKSAYVQLRSPPAKRASELLQDSVVGLMAHLLSGQGGALACAGADAVRSWFDGQLASDVPEACLTALQSLLKKLVASEGFFDIGDAASGAIIERAAVDWSAVRQQLGAILGGETVAVTTSTPGKRKKEKVEVVAQCVRMADYMGVVTAAVLFQRLLSTSVATSTPALSVASPAEAFVDHIAGQLSALAASPDLGGEVLLGLIKHRDGAAAAFLSALRWAEQRVNSLLCIPAFECTRTGGSFLSLLETHLKTSLLEEGSSGGNAPPDASQQLLAAVMSLQATLFPVCAGTSPLEPGEERSGAADNRATHEHVNALLSCVQQRLQAVLSAWEFEAAEAGSAQPVASVLLALLLDVEAHASEDGAEGAAWGRSSEAPSFLRLFWTILDDDPELMDRLSSAIAARSLLADVANADSGAEVASNNPAHVVCEASRSRISLSFSQ